MRLACRTERSSPESVRATGNGSITGRFIRYTTPGGGADPLSQFTGLWTLRLVG